MDCWRGIPRCCSWPCVQRWSPADARSFKRPCQFTDNNPGNTSDQPDDGTGTGVYTAPGGHAEPTVVHVIVSGPNFGAAFLRNMRAASTNRVRNEKVPIRRVWGASQIATVWVLQEATWERHPTAIQTPVISPVVSLMLPLPYRQRSSHVRGPFIFWNFVPAMHERRCPKLTK
jgi:hypothetical protein